MDEEMKALLAKLTARDDELKALVAQANEQAKLAGQVSADTKAAIDGLVTQQAETHARMLEIEQKQARRTDLAQNAGKSVGELFSEDDSFKKLATDRRGTARMGFKSLGLNATVNNLGSGGSGSTGGMGDGIAPDRLAGLILPPNRPMTIRSLLMPGRTGSNLIQYVQETGFQNMAAPVAEGATKPQSDMTLELLDTTVKTLAHWIKASNQVLADIPLLQSYIDGRLRYGLMFEEETQLLSGDGTGQNLLGLIPQATAYNTALTLGDDTNIDILRRAMLQVRVAEYQASGIILNPVDWAAIETIKDANGRYIFGDPSGLKTPAIWNRPVIDTNAMPQGHFLVGAFNMAAQIFDREDANVQVSTEDSDNFVKNLVTIRAEERLAMAVYRPQAIIYGALG